MGFFSFKTQDTNRSIMNCHTDQCKPVYMKTDRQTVYEPNYEGYGVFGDQDFYDLVFDMNDQHPIIEEFQRRSNYQFEKRELGILIYYGCNGIIIKENSQIFYGHNVDFFNWQDDLIFKGMSANQLLNNNLAKKHKMTFFGTKFPNFFDNKDSKWTGKKPEDCPEQGYDWKIF